MKKSALVLLAILLVAMSLIGCSKSSTSTSQITSQSTDVSMEFDESSRQEFSSINCLGKEYTLSKTTFLEFLNDGWESVKYDIKMDMEVEPAHGGYLELTKDDVTILVTFVNNSLSKSRNITECVLSKICIFYDKEREEYSEGNMNIELPYNLSPLDTMEETIKKIESVDPDYRKDYDEHDKIYRVTFYNGEEDVFMEYSDNGACTYIQIQLSTYTTGQAYWVE